MALTRNEFLEGVAPRREDAVGTDEAQRVVDRRRGDKVLVGRRAQIFTIMNRVQTKTDASLAPVVLTSREVRVIRPRRRVPRKNTVGDADDLVTVANIFVLVSKGKHRGVVCISTLGHRQTLVELLLDASLDILWRPPRAIIFLAEEGRVAARDVTAAHNIAHHHHILRLRDHRFRVARIMTFNSLHRRVRRDLHVSRAKERRARITASHSHHRRHHAVLDKRTSNHKVDLPKVRRRRILTLRVDLAEKVSPTGGQACKTPQLLYVIKSQAQSLASIFKRNVNKHVRLFIEDDNVEVVGLQHLARVNGRRPHAIKLTTLRGALQHLKAFRIIRNLKRRRRENATATEGTRLVPSNATFKLLRTLRARNIVHMLLLRRGGNVQQELWQGKEGVVRLRDFLWGT